MKIGVHNVIAYANNKTDILNYRKSDGKYFRVELWDGQKMQLVFFTEEIKHYENIEVNLRFCLFVNLFH